MHRIITRRASALLLLACVLAVTGCVPKPVSRSDQGMVWGYLASAKNAQLVVDSSKSSALSVNLSKVVAPDSAWVVVYQDDAGQVGKLLGKVRFGPGTTEGVEIPLAPTAATQVFVMMFADRGKPNVFEFDQQRKDQSIDRPIFVDGAELTQLVTLRPYGVKTAPGAARIAVYRQGSIGATLTVGDIVAPYDSWVVIQLAEDDRPGKVIGLAHVPAGQMVDLPVPLQPANPRQNLFVTLFADFGEAGKFEYDPKAPLSSADQPYYINGLPVASEVPIKTN